MSPAAFDVVVVGAGMAGLGVARKAASAGRRRDTDRGALPDRSGAQPRALGNLGEELLATGTDFLDLDALPERVVIVGGGYTSLELAHLAARAGASAAIAHGGEIGLPCRARLHDRLQQRAYRADVVAFDQHVHDALTTPIALAGTELSLHLHASTGTATSDTPHGDPLELIELVRQRHVPRQASPTESAPRHLAATPGTSPRRLDRDTPIP